MFRAILFGVNEGNLKVNGWRWVELSKQSFNFYSQILLMEHHFSHDHSTNAAIKILMSCETNDSACVKTHWG